MLCQPGYGLVPLIERGDTHSPAVLELLRAYLLPMLEAGADTLVLGCTHYPFLQDAIREIAGDRLTLIDTGHAVARHLGRTLAAAHLQATGAAASPRFLSTADVLPLQAMVAALLGEAPMAQRIDIGDTAVPPLASRNKQSAIKTGPQKPAGPSCHGLGGSAAPWTSGLRRRSEGKDAP